MRGHSLISHQVTTTVYIGTSRMMCLNLLCMPYSLPCSLGDMVRAWGSFDRVGSLLMTRIEVLRSWRAEGAAWSLRGGVGKDGQEHRLGGVSSAQAAKRAGRDVSDGGGRLASSDSLSLYAPGPVPRNAASSSMAPIRTPFGQGEFAPSPEQVGSPWNLDLDLELDPKLGLLLFPFRWLPS